MHSVLDYTQLTTGHNKPPKKCSSLKQHLLYNTEDMTYEKKN